MCFVIVLLRKNGELVIPNMTRANLLHTILGASENTLSNHKMPDVMIVKNAGELRQISKK